MFISHFKSSLFDWIFSHHEKISLIDVLHKYVNYVFIQYSMHVDASEEHGGDGHGFLGCWRSKGSEEDQYWEWSDRVRAESYCQLLESMCDLGVKSSVTLGVPIEGYPRKAISTTTSTTGSTLCIHRLVCTHSISNVHGDISIQGEFDSKGFENEFAFHRVEPLARKASQGWHYRTPF